jgi:hypothetical protein
VRMQEARGDVFLSFSFFLAVCVRVVCVSECSSIVTAQLELVVLLLLAPSCSSVIGNYSASS